MKRWVCAIVGSMAALCALAASGMAEEPIKIGLSVPITGQYIESGKSIQAGVELALNELNEAGGIQGRPLEIVVGDSEGAPDIAKRIARKFVSDPKIVAEIGDFTSSCSMAAQPVYDKAGMVQMSPTSSHPGFTHGSPYSFSIIGAQAGGSPFMARAAVERLGKKRLAVAYLDTDWGISVKTLFVEEAARLGAEIVLEESYLEGTTDFSATIKRLRAAQPDALFLASMPPDAVAISKQRQQEGWEDVTVIGVLPINTPEFIELGGAAVENLIMPTTFFLKDPRPEVQNFIAAYQAAHQNAPNWFAAIGYDAMRLLADAIKQGGVERKAIQQALAAVKDYSGVTGKFTFSEQGDAIREYTLLQVKNGEFALFEGK